MGHDRVRRRLDDLGQRWRDHHGDRLDDQRERGSLDEQHHDEPRLPSLWTQRDLRGYDPHLRL
jgi:hypothetical protein